MWAITSLILTVLCATIRPSNWLTRGRSDDFSCIFARHSSTRTFLTGRNYEQRFYSGRVWQRRHSNSGSRSVRHTHSPVLDAHLVPQDLPGLISFTFDSWTSRNGDPFLSMTAHYITAPADDPNDWKLKCDQLAFTPIEGNHSGANMANIILRILDRYEIRHKVGTSMPTLMSHCC